MAADGHQWLTADEQAVWIAAKHNVPLLCFVSFVAYAALNRLSLRILNRKHRFKDRGNQALLQYGAVASTHAVVSLAASVFVFVRRDLSHCGARLFCHDDLSFRLWTVEAGYALYDFMFWQNNSGVVRPWQEMLLLHDVVTLLMTLASMLYPCRLSLALLPLQQLLQLATLADCLRRFVSLYGAPWHLRFKAYLAFMAAHMAKAAAGAALAVYAFVWMRSNAVWTLQLPEGMSALNQVYGMAHVAGSIVLALIYVKWAGGAVELTNSLVDSVKGRGGASAGAQAAPTKPPSGSRKKDRKRR